MDLVLNGLFWKVFLLSCCFLNCALACRELILITILHISSRGRKEGRSEGKEGKREETKRVQMVSVGEQLFQV